MRNVSKKMSKLPHVDRMPTGRERQVPGAVAPHNFPAEPVEPVDLKEYLRPAERVCALEGDLGAMR